MAENSEKSIQNNPDKYGAILSQIPGMLFNFVLHQDGSFSVPYISDKVLKYSGYSPNEIISNPSLFLEPVHPEDIPNIQEQIKISSETLQEYSIEHRLKTPDGETKWFHVKSSPQKLDNGDILWNGLSVDITKHKRLEDALKKSEERYQIVSELTSDYSYAFRVEPDGNIVNDWVTGALERITGFSKEELLARGGWETLIHPDDLHIPMGQLKLLLSNQSKTVEYRIIDRSGNIRWMKDFSMPDWDKKKNRLKNIYGAVQEITSQKNVEEALRESERKYRQLFNHAPAGMCEIDLKNMRFVTVNEVLCEYSGYSREEFLSIKPLDLLTKESQELYFERLAALSTEKKTSSSAEYNIVKKNKEELNVLLFNDYIYEGDDLITVRSVLHDITERKKAEKEKLTAQRIAEEQKKLALVGKIAGKMAHDFNNILSIVMGNAELSLIDCKDSKTKKSLELIYQQTLRGKNLTKNLVAFAKDQEPKQEFFSINEKIDLVLALLKKDFEGIETIKKYEPGLPDLLADPGMIEHALVNLLQNACHALSKVKHPKISIKTYCHNDRICFEIMDNGCGIPLNHHSDIYDPAFTLKGSKDVTGSYANGIRGTGYGMSNIKKYIELHKGEISFESEVNLGTKFTIILPVFKKKLTREEKTKIQKKITNFNKYILVVEDETAILDIQYNILSHPPCNHKVDIANNGQVAMDLFDRNEYDLISLDYILPGNINGMEVYKHIRNTNKTIPILFVSGNIEFLESIKKLKQKDENIDHLSKPCQNNTYVSGINNLLERAMT